MVPTDPARNGDGLMWKLTRQLVCAVSILALAGCGDDSLSLSEYDDVDVNVYFYFPNDREVSLGKVRGASACGDVAYSYAREKNLSRSDRWSYICCTIRKGSQCYEKIR